MTPVRRRFPADPKSVGEARRYVVNHLLEQGLSRWPADLLVSELATNVITHAATEFAVEVHVNGVVRVAVIDDSLEPPTPRTATDYEVGGRGLRIVESLATRWGVEPRSDGRGGKVVWFELPSED